MNKQDKELAIKIFDFYFSKCKASKMFVFPRTSDNHHFGLNCTIGKLECFLRFNNTKYHAATFKSRRNTKKLKGLRNDQFYGAEIELTSSMSCWPEFLKISVIEECLSKNEDLVATNVTVKNSFDVIVIPAAKSLEELAIKMELEK